MKNSEKVLTISIAAYNVSKYIKKTLDSCVNSGVLDKLEVLVVNDGSKDDTLEIATEYKNQYPNSIFVIDKKNGGYGSTVNLSLSIANGKYFRLLDGDDWLNTDDINSFVDELSECNEDMVISRFKRVFDSGEPDEIRDETSGDYHKTYDFNSLKSSHDWFTMHAITYKTSVIKNRIELTEHCFYTDQEYDLLPLPYIKTIRFVPYVVYCYRIGREEQSVSPTGLEKHYNDQTKVLKRMYNVFQNIEKKGDFKSKYIYSYLIRRTKFQVLVYLTISNNQLHKKELIQFIDYLKSNYPNILKEILSQSKTIWLLYYSKYLLYRPLHYRQLKKYRF